MSLQINIGIFGGDLRQVYMAASLLEKGYRVFIYHLADTVSHENCSLVYTLNELFEKCNILIGPVPMSRDQINITAKNAPKDLTIAHVAYLIKEHQILIGGNIPSPITDICNSRHIQYYDLMKNEKVTILNAIATAEGTIMEAIASSDRNLHGSNCLVLGYGRCAKVLAAKLQGMNARVTVAARSEEALAYANAAGCQVIRLDHMKCILPSFQFIFNTIPVLILDKDCLELVDKHVTIIDISSAPGGIDFDYAKQLKLNAKLCLGLPGKVAPRSSSDILVTEINALLKERSD
ncbi:MAG TPA: dipicolinate synthase subunit DpsA [Mobilitalea sp.]|nr:dipicolinate synthase subunit DpsA [Mobilitalea sp.]